MKYLDIINLLNLSNIDYIENNNNYYYSNYSQSLWNTSYNEPYTPIINYNSHQLYNKYIPENNYEYDMEINEIERQNMIYYQYLYPQYNLNNQNCCSNYDMWQKQNIVNDLQISLDGPTINISNDKNQSDHIETIQNKTIPERNEIIPEPIIKSSIIPKQNKVIDVVVNTIDDLIKLIDDNPYNVEYNYNINLEALHNISP